MLTQVTKQYSKYTLHDHYSIIRWLFLSTSVIMLCLVTPDQPFEEILSNISGSASSRRNSSEHWVLSLLTSCSLSDIKCFWWPEDPCWNVCSFITFLNGFFQTFPNLHRKFPLSWWQSWLTRVKGAESWLSRSIVTVQWCRRWTDQRRHHQHHTLKYSNLW